MLADWMKTKSVREIEQLLDKNKIPCGVVLSCNEVNEDANLQGPGHDRLGARFGTATPRCPRPAFPSASPPPPARSRSAAPKLGEHNQAVLGKLLGLFKKDLQQLKAKGVI